MKVYIEYINNLYLIQFIFIVYSNPERRSGNVERREGKKKAGGGRGGLFFFFSFFLFFFFSFFVCFFLSFFLSFFVCVTYILYIFSYDDGIYKLEYTYCIFYIRIEIGIPILM